MSIVYVYIVCSFTHPLTRHIVSTHIMSKSGSEYCVRVFMFVHMHKVLLVFVSVYKVNEHVSSVYTCPASASDPTTAGRVEQEIQPNCYVRVSESMSP